MLFEPTTLIAMVCLSLIILWVSIVTYNIFLHPLRNYPGPKLWAASRIPYSRAYLSGKVHLKISELHLKYGPVVRIAPSELIFCYPKAWEEIMGHRKKGQPEYSKDPDFWVDHKQTLVGATRENHGRLRRILAHGFSNQAMVAQQPLIQSYVSLLMKRLRAAAETGKAQEMTAWYNWTTFDVIGDLSFGEPFGCLEKAQHHPWINVIFQQVQAVAFRWTMRKLPGYQLVDAFLASKEQKKQFEEHFEMSKRALDKRLALNIQRRDFVDSMIAAKEKGQMTDLEILHNTQNLVLAGSETTATSLATITYLLCTHPHVLAKFNEEVRSSFNSESEIDLLSVQKLDYVKAVVDEALRIFPPVVQGNTRITNEDGATIHGNYVPPHTMLTIWQWAMNHDPEHFKDPELFIPERWLSDPQFDTDKKAVFQPFSYGPRSCIGKNLAIAEMRLILARLVWNFDMKIDLRSSKWIERNKLYLLWDKEELFVDLVPRNIGA